MHKPIKYISAGIKYLTNADYRFLIDSARGKYNSMPDEEYLRRRFKAVFGRELDLDNPITLNEKLQWLNCIIDGLNIRRMSINMKSAHISKR